MRPVVAGQLDFVRKKRHRREKATTPENVTTDTNGVVVIYYSDDEKKNNKEEVVWHVPDLLCGLKLSNWANVHADVWTRQKESWLAVKTRGFLIKRESDKGNRSGARRAHKRKLKSVLCQGRDGMKNISFNSFDSTAPQNATSLERYWIRRKNKSTSRL